MQPMGSVTLRPNANVTPQAIELEWRRTAKMTGVNKTTTRVIDLRDAEFVDTATLPYILALVANSDNGPRVMLDLPDAERRTLDFLRAWRLPEAVSEVASALNYSVWTDRSSEIIRSTSGKPSRYIQAIFRRGAGLESLMSETFFALTPLKLDRGGVVVARLERERWLRDHVLSVLDQQLARQSGTGPPLGREFATQVVYEAVLNASRHPETRHAFICSQIHGKHGRSELILSIWDDGKSFADTLRDALERVGTVYSPSFGLVDETFHCVLQDEVIGRPRRFDVSSRSAKLDHPHSDFLELLLGAFLLGVTSAPDDQSGIQSDHDQEFLRQFRGAGLYLLRRTAAVDLRGTIEYLTGRHQVQLKSRNMDPANYQAAVRRKSTEAPELKGNLLTVRIPLTSGRSED